MLNLVATLVSIEIVHSYNIFNFIFRKEEVFSIRLRRRTIPTTDLVVGSRAQFALRDAVQSASECRQLNGTAPRACHGSIL